METKLMKWLCDPVSWLDMLIRGAIVFGLFSGYIVASAYLTGSSIIVMQQESTVKGKR